AYRHGRRRQIGDQNRRRRVRLANFRATRCLVEFDRASDGLTGGTLKSTLSNIEMDATLEQIEREALALPARQRAQLVDKLWESLGDTTYPLLSPEWEAEIERRRQEMQEGKVKPIRGEDVSR